MTERIIYLTKHLQTHPKDFHSRRGLIALVNNRRTQLNFLVRAEAGFVAVMWISLAGKQAAVPFSSVLR